MSLTIRQVTDGDQALQCDQKSAVQLFHQGKSVLRQLRREVESDYESSPATSLDSRAANELIPWTDLRSYFIRLETQIMEVRKKNASSPQTINGLIDA